MSTNYKLNITIIFDESIQTELICNMNFSRIQKTMEALHWTYIGEEDVPDINTLQCTAEYVLKEAYKHLVNTTDTFIEVSTGGFRATGTNVGNSIELRLDFIVCCSGRIDYTVGRQ